MLAKEYQKDRVKIETLLLKGTNVRDIAKIYNLTFQRMYQIIEELEISLDDIKIERNLEQKIERDILKQYYIDTKFDRQKEKYLEKWSDISNFKPRKNITTPNRVLNQSPKAIKAREATRKYNEANSLKVLARHITNNALHYGYIKEEPCEVCGTTDNIEAHHESYKHPLDVNWVCTKCHNEKYHSGKNWYKGRKEKTNIRGYSKRGNSYVAYFSNKGEQIYLGSWPTAAEASKQYQCVKRILTLGSN